VVSLILLTISLFLLTRYQGFDFWQDSERVLASDVFTAIFLFFCAGAVNIYSA